MTQVMVQKSRYGECKLKFFQKFGWKKWRKILLYLEGNVGSREDDVFVWLTLIFFLFFLMFYFEKKNDQFAESWKGNPGDSIYTSPVFPSGYFYIYIIIEQYQTQEDDIGMWMCVYTVLCFITWVGLHLHLYNYSTISKLGNWR